MWRLGLCLAGVVIWASERLARRRSTPAERLAAAAAHLALAVVSIVGWIVDRWPPRVDREWRSEIAAAAPRPAVRRRTAE